MTEICPICNNEIQGDEGTCPFCGFKLLGSTQSFKPVSLPEDEILHVKKVKFRPALRVVRGPQDGASFDIEEGAHVIGRNPHCDIFLNDMTVSRKHATLDRIGDMCTIRDENSFNGVWVNNESVDKLKLEIGDIIQIGAFTLIFEEN